MQKVLTESLIATFFALVLAGCSPSSDKGSKRQGKIGQGSKAEAAQPRPMDAAEHPTKAAPEAHEEQARQPQKEPEQKKPEAPYDLKGDRLGMSLQDFKTKYSHKVESQRKK